jgi:hypothetical protein
MRTSGRHVSRRRDRGFSALLFDVAENRIQQHNDADRDRFVWEGGIAFVPPDRGRNRRGDQQQDDERVSELREKLSPNRNRTFCAEFIRTVL